MQAYAFIYARTHAYIHIGRQTDRQRRTLSLSHTHTHTHTHARTHARAHTHTHTYTHTRAPSPHGMSATFVELKWPNNGGQHSWTVRNKIRIIITYIYSFYLAVLD